MNLVPIRPTSSLGAVRGGGAGFMAKGEVKQERQSSHLPGQSSDKHLLKSGCGSGKEMFLVNSCVKVQCQAPQNGTVFGNRALKEVIS